MVEIISIRGNGKWGNFSGKTGGGVVVSKQKSLTRALATSGQSPAKLEGKPSISSMSVADW